MRARDELLLDDAEEEEPSMVIVLPSIEGLKENWRPISAIAVVVLLVGAAAFYLIQQDPGPFTARPLRYGDHMDFTVTETTIEVTGDEMIALLRESPRRPSMRYATSSERPSAAGPARLPSATGVPGTSPIPSSRANRGGQRPRLLW
ncbi:MAG: hypothetical protein Ct9H300mP10_10120 [Methanobacteriota archaeon]|nr:MAG: hypothetical protein Ct9H300mP10_10120 [Euryarchaeota archaeon]